MKVAIARYEEQKKEAERPSKVKVNAVIRSTNREEMKIRVKHDRIPEWKWGSMTMSLKVAEESLFDGLESGQEVVLELEKKSEGGTFIIDIQTADEVD